MRTSPSTLVRAGFTASAPATTLPATVAFATALLLASCGGADEAADAPRAAGAPSVTSEVPASPSPRLYVWAGDMDRGEGDTDFLAVVDADPGSPGYATILGTAAVGSVGNDPHHAEVVAPHAGLLFANGFEADRTFLFDLSNPTTPEFAGELDPLPGFRYVHSFIRLENGHVLATVQKGDGTRPGDTGGLAEFDAEGTLVRVTSAEDVDMPGALIRPYALEVFPEIDRVLTSSFSMELEDAENVVQLWRLSDLTLLATVGLPAVPAAGRPECTLAQVVVEEDESCSPAQIPGHARPFEIRTLPDGSAILNTIMCAFYRIHGLEGDVPEVELALNWPEEFGCAVPSRVGRFHVMPNMFMNYIATLDVSDPARPVEVARLTLEEPFMPHYTQVDEGTHRLAVTGIGPAAGSVRIYEVDPETGELTLDRNFGGPSGLGMHRENWPHGSTGAAMPHAVLFGGDGW